MSILEKIDDKEITILGEVWTIKVVELIDGGTDNYGCCDITSQVIKIRKILEHTDFDSLENCYKQTIRHEIIHAFFYESGLDNCSDASGPWAINEEMVDWFAIQGPKIFKLWKDLNI